MNQFVSQLSLKKPDVLKLIIARSKRLLKNAAAVNSTRWALFNRLKETGLRVSTGYGGLTKFNRTRLRFPKSNWIDAGGVGQIESLEVVNNRSHPKLLLRARIYCQKRAAG
ncbi:hypothetical protein IQ269_21470 [Tychonema sp. LEGE 07199]|uniref:hypothetical protein n=1 Tax=unclassified Tychonema TaxID=2642144 RepID=UPI00187FE56C|nr:hypothetical protein [Tychonema sp. LEGE 07199]MBE9134259.1 hypothetical protein [Tychonema sp. LEGE 07196]